MQAFQEYPEQHLKDACDEFELRLCMCIKHNGGQFEPALKGEKAKRKKAAAEEAKAAAAAAAASEASEVE